MEERFVDEDYEPNPLLNGVTNRIIGACIEVHRALGAGYLESCYETALAKEFKLRGIRSGRQFRFDVIYKGEAVGSGAIDFLVEDCVIVELKAIDQFAPIHSAQIISYLKATGIRLGLLINFNSDLLKNEIKRIAR